MPSNFAMSKSQFTDYMEEKKFYREDYPLDILGEFGLTEEMIYDLPDFVHETIERGGKSPLLPICIEQPFGVTRGYAKFSLVDTEEGIDVVFYPRFKQANLAVFGEEQKNALMEGKVIVADINDNTNTVIYVPTPAIGKNLTAVAMEYDISGDDLLRIWDGDLITVREAAERGCEAPVTIGVDLFTDTGVIVIPGAAAQWENTVRRTMPKYSFGNDGCWVNQDGRLSYVSEENFTKDIMDALERLAKQNGMTFQEPDTQQEQVLQPQVGEVEEEQRQFVR